MINDGISKWDDGRMISFLMIGQSNMAGRGELADVPPIKNDKCFMLRMGRWQHMSEPINPDRPVFGSRFHSGVGLAASFADSVSWEYGVEVGLIPCADGGTKICQWQPGEPLFDHAVFMTRLAMRSSRLGGIIWHQGESDCKEFNGEEYKRMFLNTMTTLRRELGAENIPLIIGELSDQITADWLIGEGVGSMNSLLRELADTVSMCDIVSVSGLQLKDDGLHFNSAAYRELGIRYFDKFKALNERALETWF